MRTVWLIAILFMTAAGTAAADEYEPNDSLESAYGPLENGADLDARIDPDGDVDWYYLDADPGALTISLADIPAGHDYDLYLTDENENIYDFSNAQGDTAELIEKEVIVGGRFWVRVESVQGWSAVESYTLRAGFDPLNTDPTVTVLAPDGGETWYVGSPETITWTASDPEDGSTLDVDIDFSADGGQSWWTVATGLANTGTHPWTVLDLPTGQGLVRVAVTDSEGGGGADTSDAVFTVEPAAGSAHLSLASGLAADAGGVLTIPVHLDLDASLATLEAVITYDGDILSANGVGPYPRVEGFALASNFDIPGKVRFTLDGEGLLLAAGSGPIVSVQFTVGTAASGSTAFVFPEASATDSLGRALSTTAEGGSAVITPVVPSLALTVPEGLLAVPGGELDVAVDFDHNVPVGALQFTLTYPTALLDATAVTPDTRTAAMIVETNLSVAGEVRVVLYSQTGTSLAPDTGPLCVIRFDVPAEATGSGPLGLTDVLAGDPTGVELTVTATGAGVTPVRDVALSVEAGDAGVRLAWTGQSYGPHAGFRVLRDEGGEPEPVHAGLLGPSVREFLDGSARMGAGYRYWLEAVDRDGSRQRFGPVSVETPLTTLWAGLPYPNPSRAEVRVDVRTVDGAPASAVVVDMSGRVVRRLQVPPAGAVLWDGLLESGRPAPAGIYFLRVGQTGRVETRRLVRLAR